MTAATALVPTVPGLPVDSLREQTCAWPMKAAELEVVCAASYARCAEYLQSVKALQKHITKALEPSRQQTRAAWQAVIDLEKSLLEELNEAEAILKPKAVAYHHEQARIAREAAARAEAEARAIREKAEAEAKVLEAAGEREMAQVALINAEIAAAPPAVIAPPRVQGMSVREAWTFRVTDLEKLVKAVAAGEAPLSCLQANDTYLGQRARADKLACAIPGVEVYDKGSMGVRAR